MSIFKNLPFSFSWQNKIFRIYGLLSNKFNTGDYQDVRRVRNFADDMDYSLRIRGMYDSAETLLGKTHYEIGEWPLTSLKEKVSVIEYGKSITENFFYPMDLLLEKKELSELLGPPKKIHSGVMLTSGRTLLLVRTFKRPLILKFGTSGYSGLKNFNMRLLTNRNILISLATSKFSKLYHNIIEEEYGISFSKSIGTKPSLQDDVTAIYRTLDFKRNNIGSQDFLVPLTAFLSEEFWNTKNLIQSLGLDFRPKAALFEDLKELFKNEIIVSLTESFVHFQCHHQNLSVGLHKGHVTKLLHHDLQDALFDCIGFTLKEVSEKLRSRSSDKINLEELYVQLFERIRFSDNNLCNQLIHPNSVRSTYDVLSYYLRFFKHLGNYDFYFSRLGKNSELFRQLANLIYKDPRIENIRDKIIDFDELAANRHNLFWVIDKINQKIEEKYLSEISAEMLRLSTIKLDPENVFGILERSRVACSRHFPFHLTDIDKKLISDAKSVYEEKIIFLKYNGKQCLIIAFQGAG